MRFVAAAIAVAALAAVAASKSCNTTTVESVMTSTEADTCESASGYSVSSMTTPTDSELAKMCKSSACEWLLEQLEKLGPSECYLALTFPLFSGLVTPWEEYCGSSTSGSSSSKSSTSASKSSSSAGSSSKTATTTTPTPTTEAPTTSSATSSSTSISGSSSTSTLSTKSTTTIAGSSGSVEDDSTVTEPSSSVNSDSASNSSGGLGIGAIIGIIVGVVVLLLALITAWRWRKNRQASSAPPRNALDSPVLGKKVPLLEDDRAPVSVQYQEVPGSSRTYSTEGSMPDSRYAKSSLWEDPAIIAARISIDRIQLGALIGRGGFGEVYRGRYRGQDVAIKMLHPEKRKELGQIRAFLSEIRLMATMEHPYIVQFIGVAWESLSDLYCVTEFMTGGDLRTLLNDYQANGAPQGMDASKVEIAYQVAYALTYLHSLEPVVLHRDLKSRNILLTESLVAKITDFGTSRTRSDETMTAGVGSWMWMAPEVMLGEHYDEKADIFSLGVVLSELDTHELPYSHAKEGGSSEAAMMQMLSMGKLHVRFSRFTDPDTVRFAENCVSLDPRERPTAAEVLYYFQKARSAK